MIGNIDERLDWDATARCLRAGIAFTGGDSHSFMLGYQLGFLQGYKAGQKDKGQDMNNSYQAYQRDKEEMNT